MIVIVAGALVLLTGCRKPTAFTEPSSRPSTATPLPAPALTPGEDAVKTVKAYLTALGHRDYATAYNLLSKDSQILHPREKFEQQGKEGGMTPLDLPAAKVSSITETRAQVTIGHLEDPATHGYELVRENGQWKVVYRGGRPYQPYAE